MMMLGRFFTCLTPTHLSNRGYVVVLALWNCSANSTNMSLNRKLSIDITGNCFLSRVSFGICFTICLRLLFMWNLPVGK